MNTDDAPAGLVILHIDGVSYHDLRQALDSGNMPFLKKFIQEQGYEVLPYTCGVPSTTPYVQAGVLYGDNSEVPGFRWWDKEAKELVHFGIPSTFGRVADKYFAGCDPLLTDGAAIASCFPGGALETFGIGYKERQFRSPRWPLMLGVLRDWLIHPYYFLPWLYESLLHVVRTYGELLKSRILRRASRTRYAFAAMLDDLVLHHVTRTATIQAMVDGYPVIYACYYAYDEASHAFGPLSAYSRLVLRRMDGTIRQLARHAKNGAQLGRRYELLFLSDHGQVDTTPFFVTKGQTLGSLISAWCPSHGIVEVGGVTHEPEGEIAGTVILAASGGLAHLYDVDTSARLSLTEVHERLPGLVYRLSREPGIGFVMARDGEDTVLFSMGAPDGIVLNDCGDEQTQELLGRYGEPELVAKHLLKLNAQERAGDLVIFGDWDGATGTNFEAQVGGHGAMGGNQTVPFLLAKRSWGFNTDSVTDASDLHTLLISLRRNILG